MSVYLFTLVVGKSGSPKKKAKRSDIEDSDLMLLTHLFFLPYEHGEQAKRLISEFKWLKQNAPPIHAADKKPNSVSKRTDHLPHAHA